MRQVREGSIATDTLLITLAMACGILIVGLTRQSDSVRSRESIAIAFSEQAAPVLAGREQTVTLTLTNNSQTTATDIQLAKSCSCSGVEVEIPAEIALEAGESVELDAIIHPDLNQTLIAMDYLVSAVLGDTEYSAEQSIQIPIEPPFQGWPEVAEGEATTETGRTVLRIGPMNPLYFAEKRANAEALPAEYRWEVRDSDLATVPATLATDHSELWVEIPLRPDGDEHDDDILMFSSRTDRPSSPQRIFVPVVF